MPSEMEQENFIRDLQAPVMETISLTAKAEIKAQAISMTGYPANNPIITALCLHNSKI
jgi:hypothetical protein